MYITTALNCCDEMCIHCTFSHHTSYMQQIDIHVPTCTNNYTCACILCRDWTKQQMEEKSRMAMEQQKADGLYNNKSIEMDQRAVELSFADAQTRRALNVAIKEYNKAMVSAKTIHHCKTVKESTFIN